MNRLDELYALLKARDSFEDLKELVEAATCTDAEIEEGVKKMADVDMAGLYLSCLVEYWKKGKRNFQTGEDR